MFDRFHTILVCAAAITLIIAGCTINKTSNTSDNPVTKQDLSAATQILGGTMSVANSGVVLSISDALSILAHSNLNSTFASSAKSYAVQQSNNKSNYSRDYNPNTGVHTVSFKREVDNPFFHKSETDTLKYIYRDSKSNFIEFPRKQRARIASVNFYGWRRGTISTLHKTSSFTRHDTLLVTGFLDPGSKLRIEGTHNDAGSIIIDQPGKNSIERSYILKITFLDVQFGKAVLNKPQSVAKEAKGKLSWQLKYTEGVSRGTKMSGTIKLVGDGTALLRLQRSPTLFQINLKNGDIKNLSHSFGGRVSAVNPAARHFMLASGLNVVLPDWALIIGKKKNVSLQAVQKAVGSNIPVWAEGIGTLKGNIFNSSRVIFKPEVVQDSTRQGIAFEEVVTSANGKAQTFTVAGQVTIRITDRTTINQQGAFSSLKEVIAALNKSRTVVAKGRVLDQFGSKGIIVAKNVIFMNKENGN